MPRERAAQHVRVPQFIWEDDRVTLWGWLWAWTRDDAVWDWVRTISAGLIGALIAGVFTLRGQARQAEVQAVLQREQFEASSRANESKWVRDRSDAAYAESLAAARELFEGFTEVQREIQRAQPTLSEIMSGENWDQKWEKIWTEQRSLNLDVRARLIAEEESRDQVKRIVGLMDQAKEVARESHHPTALQVELREIVSQLSAEGIEVMGAYIRHQPHVTERGDMFDILATGYRAFEAWQDHEIKAAVAREEAQADAIADAAGSSEYPQEP